MMLRHSLGLPEEADMVERAVTTALAEGNATQDLGGGLTTVGMTDAVLERILMVKGA
jgi:3-isopropylmalate dehydrogenase